MVSQSEFDMNEKAGIRRLRRSICAGADRWWWWWSSRQWWANAPVRVGDLHTTALQLDFLQAFQQERALKSHFEYRTLDALFALSSGIVCFFDFGQAVFELFALCMVCFLNRGWERRVLRC